MRIFFERFSDVCEHFRAGLIHRVMLRHVEFGLEDATTWAKRLSLILRVLHFSWCSQFFVLFEGSFISNSSNWIITITCELGVSGVMLVSGKSKRATPRLIELVHGHYRISRSHSGRNHRLVSMTELRFTVKCIFLRYCIASFKRDVRGLLFNVDPSILVEILHSPIEMRGVSLSLPNLLQLLCLNSLHRHFQIVNRWSCTLIKSVTCMGKTQQQWFHYDDYDDYGLLTSVSWPLTSRSHSVAYSVPYCFCSAFYFLF